MLLQDNIENMKSKSYRLEKWYANIALILILIAVVLSICTSASLFFVGDIVSKKLYDMTVKSVLQRQAKASSQISYHIIDMPSVLGNFLNMDNSSGKNANSIFRKLSSVETELIAISIIDYDEDEEIKRVDASTPSSDYNRLLKDPINLRTQLAYGDNTILSIGTPFKDDMGIYTIIPVYYAYYSNGKVSRVLILEYNVSVLFFKTLTSNLTEDDQYTYSIYSQDNTLMETSKNYMKIIKALPPSEYRLNLSASEINTIKTKGSYYRINGDMIELYSSSEMGYIIKGEVPFKYIEQTNKEITSKILTITVLSIFILFIMSGILLHIKRSRENNIRMAIETIQAKLDPHFLFNTLNSMVGLVSSGEDEKLMKGFRNLSIFLRSSIDTKLFVSLRDELNLLTSYFEIQKMRYSDAFEYSYEIESDNLLDANIPRFTIQPIVENCFVHAVALITTEETIHIKITIKKTGKKNIAISILNNGKVSKEDLEKIKRSLGRTKVPENDKHGIGLALINKELKLLYGRKYGLKLGNISDDFFEIIINVPFSL